MTRGVTNRLDTGKTVAEYGKEILQTLSGTLTQEYGKGFTEKALWRMMQFAEVFPNADIVATLSRQLSWSVRALRHKIGHLLYERTAVAKKSEEMLLPRRGWVSLLWGWLWKA
ncbi:MAG: DUF1016 N-terminal domain-containing protein [Pirellula sp.]